MPPKRVYTSANNKARTGKPSKKVDNGEQTMTWREMMRSVATPAPPGRDDSSSDEDIPVALLAANYRVKRARTIAREVSNAKRKGGKGHVERAAPTSLDNPRSSAEVDELDADDGGPLPFPDSPATTPERDVREEVGLPAAKESPINSPERQSASPKILETSTRVNDTQRGTLANPISLPSTPETAADAPVSVHDGMSTEQVNVGRGDIDETIKQAQQLVKELQEKKDRITASQAADLAWVPIGRKRIVDLEREREDLLGLLATADTALRTVKRERDESGAACAKAKAEAVKWQGLCKEANTRAAAGLSELENEKEWRAKDVDRINKKLEVKGIEIRTQADKIRSLQKTVSERDATVWEMEKWRDGVLGAVSNTHSNRQWPVTPGSPQLPFTSVQREQPIDTVGIYIDSD